MTADYSHYFCPNIMNGVTLKNVHSQQQKYHDKIKITVTWRQKSL